MNLAETSALTFTIQSFVTLLVIMDPPGATPIFLGLVADKSAKVRRQLAVQAALVSLLITTALLVLIANKSALIIEIDDQELRVGRAHIELEFVKN